MSSLASVDEFAAAIAARVRSINLLVCNAGTLSGNAFDAATARTIDGLETTFATNHLSHFALVARLEAQVRGGSARVVLTSSEGHAMVKPDSVADTAAWRRVATETGRDSCLSAYCKSKLANVLHAHEIQRRWAADGVTANALHPGSIRETGIWATQHGCTACCMDWCMVPIGKLFCRWQTVDQGGDAIMACADQDEKGGRYRSVNRWVEPSPLARDPVVAAALWEASEELVALRRGATSH